MATTPSLLKASPVLQHRLLHLDLTSSALRSSYEELISFLVTFEVNQRLQNKKTNHNEMINIGLFITMAKKAKTQTKIQNYEHGRTRYK